MDLSKAAPPRSDETTAFVRRLAGKNLDHDQVARELAPLFGLGSGILAIQKVKCLFLHVERSGTFEKFNKRFIGKRWGLPGPEWVSVYDLVTKHKFRLERTKGSYPGTENTSEWDVNHYYAEFIASIVIDAEDPTSRSSLISWLRRGNRDEHFWTLYHTLVYLQSEAERINMPLKDRLVRRLTLKN
ncbi:hypothetical protein SCAR479_03430 [Seiridium cardinale]|uniref:Uncharacterized protein n=1 Tax=Seiridium cardinale TaxID=138064 RepID=A0ABR2Y198_9PEZI